MNYTIHQLNVFLKVVENESVTKAAEALHLTQPAVSIQLKNFQDQFEIPLTETVGRKLYVTDFGLEIARSARLILAELNEIDNKTLAHKGFMTGRLVISSVSTGKYLMPYFLSSFIQDNPGIELVLDVTNKSRVIESLEKNEIDFALVSILPEQLSVEKIDLMPNKLFLVANKKNLQIKKKASEKIFESLPLIFRESGSGTRHMMTKYFNDQGMIIKKKMELTSNEAVKQAVIAGLGCSIMPVIGLKNELLQDDLHIVPVKGLPLVSTWHLTWLKNKKLSPAANAYLSHIRRHKEDIMQQYFNWYQAY
jgi:LysR family transcriptional regulator, low CO2-responsive transcriptional regulator